MPPFLPCCLCQSGNGPDGSGRQAEATTGGDKSNCKTEIGKDGWKGERRRKGDGGFRLGRVVCLEIACLPVLATLSKSLKLGVTL